MSDFTFDDFLKEVKEPPAVQEGEKTFRQRAVDAYTELLKEKEEIRKADREELEEFARYCLTDPMELTPAEISEVKWERDRGDKVDVYFTADGIKFKAAFTTVAGGREARLSVVGGPGGMTGRSTQYVTSLAEIGRAIGK